MGNLKQIINSAIKKSLDKQTVIKEIADLKTELNSIEKQGQYDEYGSVLNKKEKLRQIKNSIELLEDLKNDLQINNINLTYLENFGYLKNNSNGIIGLNNKKLEKNYKINGVSGGIYIISAYIEVMLKSDLGENLDKPNLKIVIIDGLIYEFNEKNKKISLINFIEKKGMNLFIKKKINNTSNNKKETSIQLEEYTETFEGYIENHLSTFNSLIIKHNEKYEQQKNNDISIFIEKYEENKNFKKYIDNLIKLSPNIFSKKIIHDTSKKFINKANSEDKLPFIIDEYFNAVYIKLKYEIKIRIESGKFTEGQIKNMKNQIINFKHKLDKGDYHYIYKSYKGKYILISEYNIELDPCLDKNFNDICN